MNKGKVVHGDAVSRFDLPSFEGMSSPKRSAREPSLPARSRERSAADLEREGYSRGFEAGRKAAAESVAREAQPLLTGLREAVAGVNGWKEQIAEDAEPQLVELALAIARRIVVGELSEDPGRIAAIVKEAIRRIERAGPVTIRVHPDLARKIKEIQANAAEFQAEILLDVDPSVPPNGPIVTGATEEVLTDVDEQIRIIAEELRSERATR